MTRLQMVLFIASHSVNWAPTTGKTKQIGYARSIKSAALPGLNRKEQEVAFEDLCNPASGLRELIYRFVGAFRRENGIQIHVGHEHLVLDHRAVTGLPVRSMAELIFLPAEELARTYEVLRRFNGLYSEIVDMILIRCRRASMEMAG